MDIMLSCSVSALKDRFPCVWPMSPPLSESGPPQVPPGTRYVVGPRTTLVVQERPATYGPLSETSTSPPRSMAADTMPFGRVGIGCDSLSAASLWIKSQEPSLRGIFYYPPAPPMGDFNLLARSSTEVCSIPLPLHIRFAPVSCPLHSPHIFRGFATKRDCSLR